MQAFWKVVSTIGSLLFPVFAYAVLEYRWLGFNATHLIWVAVVLVVMRLAGTNIQAQTLLKKIQHAPIKIILAVMLGALSLVLLGFFIEKTLLALLYPVLVSWAFASIFFISWLYPPSLIERIARYRDPSIPAEASPYLTTLSLVWAIWLLLNGSISLYLALVKNHAAWALYCGFISYVLSGLLLVGEWIFRRWLLPSHAR